MADPIYSEVTGKYYGMKDGQLQEIGGDSSPIPTSKTAQDLQLNPNAIPDITGGFTAPVQGTPSVYNQPAAAPGAAIKSTAPVSQYADIESKYLNAATKQSDINTFKADSAKVQDLLNRAQNLATSPDPRDQQSPLIQQYNAEAQELMARVKQNREYGYLGSIGAINLDSVSGIKGATSQEQAAQDQVNKQADIARATQIGQQTGTLAPGQQAASQLNAAPTPIPGQTQASPTGTQQVEGAQTDTEGTQTGSQLATASSGITGVYKQGEDIFVVENGQPRHINLDEFKQLGINASFLKEGQPISLDQARTGQPSEQERNQQVGETLQKYGSSVGQADFQQNPMRSFEQAYTDIVNSMGLNSIKDEFTRVQKQFSDMQNELNDKIADINEDPWLTEGVRVQRIRNLQNRYEGKLSILENQMKLYDSLYQQGRDEARFVAQTSLEQYNKERQFQQDQLEYAQSRADKQAEAQSRLQQQGFENDLALKQFGLDKLRASQSGSDGGLTRAQINSTVNQIVGAFDNEPIVKQFNVIQEAKSFVDSLSNTTTNPSDDQALIYAFAKVMDPNSVVREGEYATVQKYSQSWAKSFGGSFEQALSGTGFLSASARESIKKTIDSRYSASEQTYKNLEDQYQGRINEVLGGGYNTLTKYGSSGSENNLDLNDLNAYLKENNIQLPAGVSAEDALEYFNSGQTFKGEGSGSTTLGSLSQKYESSGNPGIVSTGVGDKGGVSYGTYQLTTNNVNNFLQAAGYSGQFKGLQPGTTAFNSTWKQVAAKDPSFAQAQEKYIEQTHFTPQIEKITSVLGKNPLTSLAVPVLQAIWSTAVQHGPNTNIIADSIKKVGISDPVALVKEIYKRRWAGGANFSGSSKEVQQSVYNRFFGPNGELNTVLRELQAYI